MGFWQGRSVLVTGHGGFLAGPLIEELNGRGAVVTGLDREPPPRPIAGVHCEVGDVLDAQKVAAVLAAREIQTCFHLAGMSSVKRCQEAPSEAFEANCRGTQTFLEGCRLYGAATEIVATSSNHVYGEQNTRPTPEGAPLRGEGAYAASKAAGDIVAQCCGRSYGMPIGIARITNTYGGADPHGTHLITGTIAAVARGERPLVRGNGEDKKGFLYIADTIAGLLALAEHVGEDKLGGEAFNFAPDESIRVLDAVDQIVEAMDAVHLTADIRGDASYQAELEHLANDKAAKLLGWRPQHTYREGFRRAIEDHRRAQPFRLRT